MLDEEVGYISRPSKSVPRGMAAAAEHLSDADRRKLISVGEVRINKLYERAPGFSPKAALLG